MKLRQCKRKGQKEKRYMMLIDNEDFSGKWLYDPLFNEEESIPELFAWTVTVIALSFALEKLFGLAVSAVGKRRYTDD